MSHNANTKPVIGPKVALAFTTALASVTLAGCTTNAAPRAESSFSQAQTQLAKGNHDKAVAHAEAAVLAEPRNAGFRALLGAAYLEAGRFQAAATSFNDAIELGDSDPRTILSYALAEVAVGNNAAAVSMLDQWEGAVDPADLGLAFALAGQPDRGVHVLANALRGGQNTAKVRQNLGLCLRPSGQLARSPRHGRRRRSSRSGRRPYWRMGSDRTSRSFPAACCWPAPGKSRL